MCICPDPEVGTAIILQVNVRETFLKQLFDRSFLLPLYHNLYINIYIKWGAMLVQRLGLLEAPVHKVGHVMKKTV